ncbi:MAG: hypothetical protein IKD69_09720 [Solobacterium sp.]|nr:hypothetical protein [Solobacterium sp.]
MKKEDLIESYVHAEVMEFDGFECVRVVKHKDKLYMYDENTYARIAGTENFHNGTIEVKVLSKLLPDAPDLARGFIGLAFRINADDSAFESWYIRPTNGPRMTDNPVRLSHGTQYFSYPNYTFEYFRNHGITKYDSKADIALDEWITIKAVIEDEKGTFYVNDQPVLTVDEMIHGKGERGAVGLFVDIGTEGYFRDLKITYKD